MNKPVYLGMSILDISKTLMYEFWYDYIKPQYQDNAKVCYTALLFRLKLRISIKILQMTFKNGLTYRTIVKMIKKPLPRGINKKVTEFFRDELGGKIMIEFVDLRPKTYFYLMDDGDEKKKAKGTNKCVIKRILKFNDYNGCLLNNKIILKSQQRFKRKAHNLYTEQINQIGLGSNDDKRL